VSKVNCIAAFLAAAWVCGPVFGATVDLEFDTFEPTPVYGTFTESGMSYQNSTSYVGGDYMYLHDDSGGIKMSEIKGVNGERFDAVSADITGYSRVYQTGNKKKPKKPRKLEKWLYGNNITYDNFAFYGFRDGLLVASQKGSINGSFSQLMFGADFTDLDLLVAELLVPKALNSLYNKIRKRKTLFCDEWCAGFQVDRLGLNVREPAPVPLPAGLPLLAAGLGGLGLIVRRKRA
jgi:hypothetical protein